MLKAVELPAGVSDLDTGLTNVNGDDFAPTKKNRKKSSIKYFEYEKHPKQEQKLSNQYYLSILDMRMSIYMADERNLHFESEKRGETLEKKFEIVRIKTEIQ